MANNSLDTAFLSSYKPNILNIDITTSQKNDCTPLPGHLAFQKTSNTQFTDMLQRIKIEYITQLLNIKIQAEPTDQKPQKKQSIGNRMLTPFD